MVGGKERRVWFIGHLWTLKNAAKEEKKKEGKRKNKEKNCTLMMRTADQPSLFLLKVMWLVQLNNWLVIYIMRRFPVDIFF